MDSEDEAVAVDEEVVEDDSEMQQDELLGTQTLFVNGSGDAVAV